MMFWIGCFVFFVLLFLVCFWMVQGGCFWIFWIVFGWLFLYFGWFWVVVLVCVQPLTIEISIVIIGCPGLAVLFFWFFCHWVVFGRFWVLVFLIRWVIFGWSVLYFGWSWVVVLGCMQQVTIEISIVII